MRTAGKRFLSTVAIIAASATFSVPAQAQLVASGLSCTSSSALTIMGAIACSGAWQGNDAGSTQAADVLAQLQSDFATKVGSGAYWSYTGTTNAGSSSGPFSSVPGAPTGTLNLDMAITGWFAVALKSSTNFSLYLFNGGTAGISSVGFVTNGTSVNRSGIAQDLSHASLYRASPGVTAAPEPSTYVLMLTGLAVMVLLSRRRRAGTL